MEHFNTDELIFVFAACPTATSAMLAESVDAEMFIDIAVDDANDGEVADYLQDAPV